MESPEFLDKVKTLVIIAMFSDDDLMERLVLKGGNLLDLVYRVSARASLDVDFSLDGDIEENEEELRRRIDNTLSATFAAEGFHVFDVNLTRQPPRISEDFRDFWGGYRADFKIIGDENYHRFQHDAESLRRNAAKIGRRESTRFTIDISRHEYCGDKQAFDVGGYRIYGLSPQMFVCEKLRAICQQMEEYARLLKKSTTTRARDFLDFFVVVEAYHVDFRSEHLRSVCQKTFEAKRVPLRLLGRIKNVRAQHEDDFLSVRDTVRPGYPLEDFGFYFDYLVQRVELLKPLWDE